MGFNSIQSIYIFYLYRQQPSEQPTDKDFIFARQCPKGYYNAVMKECRENENGQLLGDDWYDGFKSTHNKVWYKIRKAEQHHKRQGNTEMFTFFGHKATKITSL